MTTKEEIIACANKFQTILEEAFEKNPDLKQIIIDNLKKITSLLVIPNLHLKK